MPPLPACPICGKPPQEKYRPFCGRHCAQIDLGRWFGESYRIPDNSPPVPDEEP